MKTNVKYYDEGVTPLNVKNKAQNHASYNIASNVQTYQEG